MTAKSGLFRGMAAFSTARGAHFSCIIAGLLLLSGCSTGLFQSKPRPFFSVQRYSDVQLKQMGEGAGKVMPVETLLLLEPIGGVSGRLAERIHLAVRQEMQTLLPGSVRTLEKNRMYERYTEASNLVLADGAIAADEVFKIGRAAKASHVMIVKIVDYRAYHPQRLMMEWVLFDVEKKQIGLVLSGGLDASEYDVELAAVDFMKGRRADPFTEAGLDVLLRSPREYVQFAVVQAVDVLKTEICPAYDVLRP